jgi:hypothetical protein
MITCPNCNHENMTGAAFCADCGTLLLNTQVLTVQQIRSAPPAVAPSAGPATAARAASPSDNWLTLHLLDSGEMLPLADRNEFTLGRVSEGQPVMPDIDLGPYQAFTHGVSRLHAVIRRGVNDVLLSDLASANGTFINGQRLPADEERALAHGDVVSLGSLKLQILFRNQ